jgi:hypothetical protein
MNKRSAMMVAAGLVLTLVVGGVAVAVGVVGPSTSAAGPRTVRREHPRPIVKTKKRTVKVHRSGGVVAVPVATGSSVSSSLASSASGPSDDGQDQVGQHQSGDQSQMGGSDDSTEQGSGGDDYSGEPGDDSGSGQGGSGGGDD